MAWYYEILSGKKIVVEQSKTLYRSQWEAEWAGYCRLKDNVGGTPLVGNVRARHKD
jgi:hypothetical protein